MFDPSDDTDSDSSGSSDSELEKARRKKKKKKKSRAAKPLKAVKRHRRAKESSSESDSEASSDSSSVASRSSDSASASSSSSDSDAEVTNAKLATMIRKLRLAKSKERGASDSKDSAAVAGVPDVRIALLEEQIASLTTKLDEIRDSASTPTANESDDPEEKPRRSRRRRGTARTADDEDDPSEQPKFKRASKMAFKRVDYLYDRNLYEWILRDTNDSHSGAKYDSFVFTVRRNFSWEGQYTFSEVHLASHILRDSLKEIMGEVKGVSLVEDTPIMDPQKLFLYLPELELLLKSYKKRAKKAKKSKQRKMAAKQAKHLGLLVKYVNKDFSKTKKTLYPLLENNSITFDLLWALFKPDTIVHTATHGYAREARCYKAEQVEKQCHVLKGCWYEVQGRYLEYDGKDFGWADHQVDITEFRGARKINSLACYPIQYHKSEAELRHTLVDRGRKFTSMVGQNYRTHKGMAFMVKRKQQTLRINIDGRIMIDPGTFRRIIPNYPFSSQSVRPKHLEGSGAEDASDSGSGCSCSESESEYEDQQVRKHGKRPDGGEDIDKPTKKKRIRIRWFKNKVTGEYDPVEVDSDDEVAPAELKGLTPLSKSEEDPTPDQLDAVTFSDEDLLLASPVVYGFAFAEKLWLEFTVSGISPIVWNDTAFDSLVLPDSQKNIVRALVESHVLHSGQNIDDVILGKGQGLVAVLHGPPGTGKTLTAEGTAEYLKRPLYSVSIGELGTSADTLERELKKILDIAHGWGAVLLLDEADVFLETRTVQDIHRNALVSIFLRLLEYFQGILFLTTNRVETFDEAFQSRIHIALRYGELKTAAKKSVWKLFINKVKSVDGVSTELFKESDFDSLARRMLNGRQIKNMVRTSQALALNEGVKLGMKHIKQVLEVAESFDRDLKGGTGYEDAMRSYH